MTARSGTQRARLSYALRGCSRALLAGSKPAPASCSQVAAGGGRWLLTAVRGTSRGHGSVMRGPGSRRRRRQTTFRFSGRTYPSCHGSCERNALSPVADGSRWSLLLLSPSLSTRRRPAGRKPTRTLQGMARVRSGQVPACPLVSGRRGVRRHPWTLIVKRPGKWRLGAAGRLLRGSRRGRRARRSGRFAPAGAARRRAGRCG